MSLTKEEKTHEINHTASASAACIGAGLAQLPLSDKAPIAPIQIGMIVDTAPVHGRKISEATAAAIPETSAAALFGRAASQLLLGWLPGLGNAAMRQPSPP